MPLIKFARSLPYFNSSSATGFVASSPRKKIIYTFLITIFLLVLGMGYSYYLQYNFNKSAQSLREQVTEYVELTQQAGLQYGKMMEAWRYILIKGREDVAYRQGLRDFYENDRQVRQLFRQLVETVKDEPILAMQAQRLVSAHKQAGRIFRQAIRAFNAADNNPHVVASQFVEKIEDSPSAIISKLIALSLEVRDRKVQHIQDEAEFTNQLIMYSLLGFIVLATVTFLVIVDRSVARPAEEALTLGNILEQAQKSASFGARIWHNIDKQEYWSGGIYKLLKLARFHYASEEEYLNHVHPQDIEKLEDQYREVIKNKNSYETEYRVIDTGKEIHFVLERGIAIVGAEGRLLYVVSVVSDITEIKNYENELLKGQRELESIVAQRTRELEVANHKLVNSNNELQSYSYSIAHDLRTPLRSIVGFSQILKEELGEKMDAEYRNYLERIILSGKKMSDLIDDILSLSKVTRHDLKKEKVDLTRMARDIIKTIEHAQDSHRDYKLNIEEDLQTTADPQLLYQLMMNLLGNAWKYTGKNPFSEIRVFRASGLNNTFVIEDNGVGFDMSDAGHLFEPFHRLHTDSEFEGTGIGLATVKRIVDRHGGKVWAESEPGKGTRIYFSL